MVPKYVVKSENVEYPNKYLNKYASNFPNLVHKFKEISLRFNRGA